jgi:hypothetical protein
MFITQAVYDGSFIHKRFAYEHLRKDVSATGDIVSFIAPMNVKEHLIDLEDTLSNDFIWSDLAFNFCWEIPKLEPFGAVAFQRLFNANVSSLLQKFLGTGERIIVDGDDIRIGENGEKKASVSITYVKNDAALGHLGINIIAGANAPDFAYSTNITNPDAQKMFMEMVESGFYEMTKDIFIATTKVIG